MLNCRTCTIRGGRRAHFSAPLMGATWSGARTLGGRGWRVVPPRVDGVSDGAVGDTEGNWSGRSAVLDGSTPNAHAPMARAGTTTTTPAALSQAIRCETRGLWSGGGDTPQGCPTRPSAATSRAAVSAAGPRGTPAGRRTHRRPRGAGP